MNEDVDNLDVHLLNAVGETEVRHPDFHIGETGQLAAVLAGEDYGFDALLFGGFHGGDDVFGIAAGGNAQERVSLYTAGEKVCPTERLKQLNLA